MDWFSRHTNWLYSETTALSNNSIYKERYQIIHRTLISTGDVLVHKSSTEYHPILIVYSEATPYASPTVYTLDHALSKEDALKLASLSPAEINKHIQGNIKFFERRHQNADGSICFLETGDLHFEAAEKYSINDILKRIRTWLSGKIPKDSQEVELFHHFSSRAEDIEYLLPDLFLDREMIKGNFYAGMSGYIPDFATKTYIGLNIFGINKNGITLLPKAYLREQLVFFARIPDIKKFTLPENKVIKEKAIKEGTLIEGYWWDINEEPMPFSDIESFAYYIGDKGNDELIASLMEPLSACSDEIHIGLRFPARPGKDVDKDWQMFRLRRKGRSPLFPSTKEELRNRLFDYSIEAVKQEYLTDAYFHMRNLGRANRNLLKRTTISIIGCGAIGSETTDALIKAGIGKIILVDKEYMHAHNAVRHCLGIDRINLPKVFGMAEHVTFHNPFVDIVNKEDLGKYSFLNILHAELNDYLPEGAIGISTIADDNVEAFLNEQAINEGRTIFYCRALRGGKVARIFRIIPHEDACKTCLSFYAREETSAFINIPEDESLPVITNECNNPVRPASAADLKVIAGLFSRIIIDYIEGRNKDKNHWIWSTEAIGKIELPESSQGIILSQMLPPHSACPVCQKLEGKKIFVNKHSFDFMRGEAAASGEIETGGILIGYREDKGQYIIERATGPGPNAVRTGTWFEKDIEYCQARLNEALSDLGERGLYLGEWHYHPAGENKPSGRDIKSLTEIAEQDNYRIDKPIMLILSPTLEFGLTIHDKTGRCVPLEMEIEKSM